MKAIICLVVLMTIAAIDYSKKQKAEHVQNINHTFVSIASGFEQIYKEQQFLYSLKKEKMENDLVLASCGYDKASNVINIHINANKLEEFKGSNLTNILLHEMEECSQKALRSNDSFANHERIDEVSRQILVAKYFKGI